MASLSSGLAADGAELQEKGREEKAQEINQCSVQFSLGSFLKAIVKADSGEMLKYIT